MRSPTSELIRINRNINCIEIFNTYRKKLFRIFSLTTCSKLIEIGQMRPFFLYKYQHLFITDLWRPILQRSNIYFSIPSKFVYLSSHLSTFNWTFLFFEAIAW